MPDWLIEWVRSEWRVLKGAPAVVILVLIAGFAAAYFIANWYFSGVISAQEANLQLMQNRISESENKIAELQNNLAAARAISAPAPAPTPTPNPSPAIPPASTPPANPPKAKVEPNIKLPLTIPVENNNNTKTIAEYISTMTDEALRQKSYYLSQQIADLNRSFTDKRINIDNGNYSQEEKAKKLIQLDKDADDIFRDKYAEDFIVVGKELSKRTNGDLLYSGVFSKGQISIDDIGGMSVYLKDLARKLH
jgi:hypothetical protein